MADKHTVVVGMSGGVDSSVTAYLLKQSGYDVIGVTMRMWSDQRSDSENPTLTSEAGDAKRVCDAIGIAHHVIDMRDDFSKYVIDDFVCEYSCGHTPNPCIMCNRHVKFAALLREGQNLGADMIATGHYARVIRPDDTHTRYTLQVADNAKKDQTYALYRLTQEQLAHTLMPLGDYSKDQIRSIAEDIGIEVAHKRDSQEICFIPDHDYAGYIERATGKVCPEGNFVSPDGTVIGRHRGIVHYTVGQRRGLGMGFNQRLFVKEIRPETDEVVLCKDEELWTDRLQADRVSWMGISEDDTRLTDGDGLHVIAKIRYNHAGEWCRVHGIDQDMIEVVFDSPVRAVTPGQSVVLYDNDGCVLGGGKIK